MRLQRQLFGSRVARRVFGSFLLASLVPLLVFAWLALTRVGNALERQAFEQLDNASRSYGQITLDKLVSVADALSDASARSATSAEQLSGVDAAALIVDGTERTLFGDWPPLRVTRPADPLRAAVSVVWTEQASQVVVARRHGAAMLLGRVAPAYLERTNGLLGPGMEVCLFSGETFVEPIHCSTPLPNAALANLRDQPTDAVRRFTWQSGGEDWLTSYWQLFLPSRFEAEPWTVVVSQPRDIALGSLTAFNRVVPQAAVLTLTLIVVLAVAQIRRTLNPLDALLAGTKRIAARDFSTPVRIDPRDEFGTLGAALNGMAGELSHQFGALRALADMDHLILQRTPIDPVLETLFARLKELVPSGRHLALLIDTDDPNHGRLHRVDDAGTVRMERVTITEPLRRRLADEPGGSQVGEAHLAALGVNVGQSRAFDRLYVAPMLAGGEVAGALITASDDDTTLGDREMRSLRELAARVAVAVAASKREAELFRRAHFDALTGLPNRELFHDRLHQAVAQAERDERALAVLFVDLDSFKTVNDTHGHPCGDELLKEAALRLTAVVRHADTVARLGGDEYAIVLPHVHGPLEAEAVAVKAIEAMRQPFRIDGHESIVGASVGVAMFPDDGATATELLRKADMAMYNAKEAGKGRFRFFAQEMDQRMKERHALHADLHHALATDQFSLAYQPQGDLRSGRFVSVEALLRWRHPQRGLVSPALFVPILEETGLINEVGTWVLRKALADFAQWRQAGLPFERVAVNVSARQLLDPGFVDLVTAALADAGLAGHDLEIELTEASLIEDLRSANVALTLLRQLGVKAALDDFGTGYSSLAYLNELAFDTLKIDRAFVVNLPTEKSVAIAKAIIAVANALGKTVVAEGIETQLQHDQLRALGCDLGQGYLLSKPLGNAELIAWAERLPPGAAREQPAAALRLLPSTKSATARS
jgi:diguanylate cyclase (GGDEF)-like protein